MDVTSFWSQACPARGASLPHAHWNECQAQHEGHGFDQCCHCGAKAGESLRPPRSGPIALIHTAPDRELLGREVDEVVTPQMLELRNLVGGFQDPLPPADHPAVTLCKLCAEEHVTFAVYISIGDVVGEARLCAGCVARMIAKSREPVPQLPANTAPPMEYSQ